LGVVLAALDASVNVVGSRGQRSFQFSDLHTPPTNQPHIETTLRSSEVITSLHVPAGPWTRRSLYLKVRDRASYEFALCSAAVALDLDGELVRHARLGLGGMAYRPWRAAEAEHLLTGKPLTEENARLAAAAALSGAITNGGNDFKPELARRTIVRALLSAKTLPATETNREL
jgi:xanthine dehydrogenase YagS FAD-binding subunit